MYDISEATLLDIQSPSDKKKTLSQIPANKPFSLSRKRRSL